MTLNPRLKAARASVVRAVTALQANKKHARASKARAVANAKENRDAIRKPVTRGTVEQRIRALETTETTQAADTIDAAVAAVSESTGIPIATIRKWADEAARRAS